MCMCHWEGVEEIFFVYKIKTCDIVCILVEMSRVFTVSWTSSIRIPLVITVYFIGNVLSIIRSNISFVYFTLTSLVFRFFFFIVFNRIFLLEIKSMTNNLHFHENLAVLSNNHISF